MRRSFFFFLISIILMLLSPPAWAPHDTPTTSTQTSQSCTTPYLKGGVTANGSAYTKKGTSVSFTCNNGTTWASDWANVDSSGNYQLCASNNSYSPCGSYYSGTTFTSCELYANPSWDDKTMAGSSRASVTLSCGSTTQKDLALTPRNKTIELSLKVGTEPITSDMTCSCNQSTAPYTYASSDVSSSGVCSLTVTEGTYSCSAWCKDYSNCSYGGYPTATVTLAASDTTKSSSLAFTAKKSKIQCSVAIGSTPITSGLQISCNQQETPWTSCSTSTASNGVYSCTVNSGTFRCQASCSNYQDCPYSGYPSDTFTIKEGDTTVPCSLKFALKDKEIRVQILAGTTPVTSGVTVYLSEQGGGWSYSSTNSPTDGKFVLKAGTGRYYVSAYCSTGSSSCEISGYPSTTVEVEEGDGVVDVTLTFLRNDSTLSGIVTDGTRGIANIGVSIYSYTASSGSGTKSAIGTLVASDTKSSKITTTSTFTTISSYATTDSNGSFQARIPTGTYTVSAYPSSDQKDLGQASLQVTTKANSTTTVSLSLSKKTAGINGTVKDANGKGISNVNISGWTSSSVGGSNDWFSATTDSNGEYSAKVIEGLTYNVSAYYWSSDPNNTVCNYNNERQQTVLASSTAQTVNFTYPACDCTLTLNAVDGNGSVLTSIYGGTSCKPASLPTGTMWYGLWGNLSGGTGRLNVQKDLEYTCTPYFWDSSFIQDGDRKATCTSGSGVVNFSMVSLDATLSGGYESGGSAVTLDQYSYLSVYASKDDVNSTRSCTTTSTGYTCKVSAGRWCLGYWIDPASGYASSSTGSSTSCEEISAGSTVTKDLTLLKTATILVTVLDTEGNGKANSWVEATPFSNRDRGENDAQRMYCSNGCNTGSDGTCSVKVGAVADGTIYYLNVYVPYYMRSQENLMTPQEVSVEVRPGTETRADPLAFETPTGTSLITVVEGSSTAALSLGHSTGRLILNEEEANPVAHASVDCFSTDGPAFQVETDDNGSATCPCSIGGSWKAVAHQMVASNLWNSEATDITCASDGTGVGTITLNKVATVPEGKNVVTKDPANEPINIELSDGFSFFCPNGAVKTSGEVTCTVDPTVTPSQAGRRPASFYGYSVNCQDENGASIVQLAGNCSFTVPCDQKQIENIGLSMANIEMSYFDSSAGAYNVIETAVIDSGSESSDSSGCDVTFEQSHLTDYIIVGNGNLAGINGEEAGTEANEHGEETETGVDAAAASAAAAACGGCYTLGAPGSLDDRILWGFLLLLYGLTRFKPKMKRCPKSSVFRK